MGEKKGGSPYDWKDTFFSKSAQIMVYFQKKIHFFFHGRGGGGQTKPWKISRFFSVFNKGFPKGSLHLKKKKITIGSDPQPPPNVTEKIMYFFSETRPLLGYFLKKSVFCPLEMSNTCKIFQNPKIARKWLSMGPPPFFHLKIFLPKWLRMAWNGF